MLRWLREHGVVKEMITLELFDYLSEQFRVNESNMNSDILFAGNLSKSTFIYRLRPSGNRKFKVYGPGFKTHMEGSVNLNWGGEFTPELIPQQLSGSFGLIWDGQDIDRCDDILGNYLKYNNPHKCSLYFVAGLPVIAPKGSAIGDFVKSNNVGLLVDSLLDIEDLIISEKDYLVMKANVMKIREKVMSGGFLKDAIKLVELKCD